MFLCICVIDSSAKAAGNLRINWIRDSSYVAEDEEPNHTGARVNWIPYVTASGNTWFDETAAGIARSEVTDIWFAVSAPSSYEKKWNADVEGTGAVTCYLDGTTVTVVGNGSKGVYAHRDSADTFFEGFTRIKSLKNLKLLHLDNVTDQKVMLPSLSVTNYQFFGWSTAELDWTPERVDAEAVIKAADNCYTGSQSNLYSVMKLLNKCDIVTQPADASIVYGENTTLTITADGVENSVMTYQWEMSNDGGSTWVEVAGATDASYTTPDKLSAGVYQYRCVANSTVDGDVKTATSNAATVNVAQKEAELVWRETSWTYDSSAHSTTCTVGNLLAGDSCAVTLDNNSITDVGSVIVEAIGLSNDNYKLPSTTTKSISITERSISGVTIAEIAPVTYTGSAHTPTPAVNDTTIRKTLVANTDFTYSYTNNINTGTATVTVNGIGNYSGTASKTFIINKADSTLTKPTIPAETLTYNKTAQTVADGASVTGDGTYSGTLYLGFGASETTVPTVWSQATSLKQTNAGTYYIWAKVEAGANHEAVAPMNVGSKTIEQKEASLTWGQLTWVYDNTTHQTTCVVSNLCAGDSCTMTLDNNSIQDVGTVTVTAAKLSNSNYMLPSDVTRTLSVTAYNLSGAAIGSISDETYKGSEHTPKPMVTATGKILTEGVDFIYSYANNVDAGTATVTITGIGNFSGTNSKDFTIKQREVTVAEIKAEDKTYDGNTDATLDFSAVTFGNIVSGDTLIASATGTFDNKNVGSNKTVTLSDLAISGADVANYKLAASGQQSSAKASIIAREVKVSGILAQDKTYDGNTNAALDFSGALFENIVSGETLSVTAKGIFSDKNAATGKTVTISGLMLTGTGATNYKLAASGQQETSTADIAQREVTLTWSNLKFTYDKMSHVPTAKAGNLVAGDTCTVAVDGAQTNAGRYTATAISLSDSNYCLPVNRTQAFEIEKASGKLSIIRSRDGKALTDGGYIILPYQTSGAAVIAATVSRPEEGTIVAASGNAAVVSASINGSNLYITPNASTGTTPISVTITAAESANYKAVSVTISVYVCDDIDISYVFSTTRPTNEDVEISITVIDRLSGIFDEEGKEHGISSVTVDGTPISGTGNVYRYTATQNGIYHVEAVDSLGVTHTEDITVSWIDREPPEMQVMSLGIVSTGEQMGYISTYIMATDNMTGYSNLRYCWDYVEGGNNTWSNTCISSLRPYASYALAVMDEAGNITTQTYTATFSDNSDPSKTNVLSDVYDDISGYIFGRTNYLDNAGALQNYQTSGCGERSYNFVFKVSPKTNFEYMEAYLTLNGAKLPVAWYSDRDCTTTIGELSTDGSSTSLVKVAAYGKISIDPSLIATKSAKNTLAELFIVRYSDTAKENRVGGEKFSMTCSVDVNAPVIALEYNKYTKTVSVRAIDAISGIPSGVVSYSINGGETTGECATTGTVVFPTTESSSSFTFEVIAADALGNRSTATKTFTPYVSTTPDAPDPVDPSDPDNPDHGDTSRKNPEVYSYKTKKFYCYIVGGLKGNTEDNLA